MAQDLMLDQEIPHSESNQALQPSSTVVRESGAIGTAVRRCSAIALERFTQAELPCRERKRLGNRVEPVDVPRVQIEVPRRLELSCD